MQQGKSYFYYPHRKKTCLFIFFTDNDLLLYGYYSINKIEQFIAEIETGEIPQELKGISLSYVKNVEKSIQNIWIKIFLKSGNREKLVFNSIQEKDEIYQILKSRLTGFKQNKKNIAQRYWNRFFLNMIAASFFFYLILTTLGMSWEKIHPTKASKGMILVLLFNMIGPYGFMCIGAFILIYQIYKLHFHLRKDSEVIELTRIK